MSPISARPTTVVETRNASMKAPLGPSGRRALARPPPPDPVREADAKGLAKTLRFAYAMAEAKYVGASPASRGRLLPNGRKTCSRTSTPVKPGPGNALRIRALPARLRCGNRKVRIGRSSYRGRLASVATVSVPSVDRSRRADTYGKATLCLHCTLCPEVQTTEQGVTIGEDANTVRLSHAGWNELVRLIKCGELGEI